MPMPRPHKGESQEAFTSRFMGDEVMMRDYPTQAQRYAICTQQWRDRNKNNEATAIFHHSPKINITATTRRIQHDGRDTIVAPVVLMVEGVHNGSAGPLYYPAEELQASASFWNGMPLPVQHPVDPASGSPVSCNSPDVIESHSVGRLWNVEFTTTPTPRLRGEIYVDVAKAQRISPDVVDALIKNQPLEVSTGLFSVDEAMQGTWNQETYNAIVRGIKPDHLALLPGSRGACSWADGCGVRANSKGGGEVDKLELTINELSLDDKRAAVARAIYAMDGPTQDNLVTAVFNDHVIYETRPGPQSNQGTTSKMYQRGYSINEDGTVALSDDIAEVRREIKYVPVTNEEEEEKEEQPAVTTINKQSQEVKTMERKEKVDALIANGQFTEDDREFLTNMDCPQFTRIVTLAESKAPKANEEPKPQTFAELVANAPADVKAQFAYNERKFKEHREGLIARIKANETNKLSDATLNGMGIETLEEIAATFRPTVNYDGGQGAFSVNTADDTIPVLGLPTLNEDGKAA